MLADTPFTLRPIALQDYADWCRLYGDYAEFYAVPQTQAMRDQVWQWLFQSQPAIFALVALNANKEMVGFMHYRTFVRPLAASTGGYVDDLFVVPEARGQGIAQQLLHAVSQVGQAQGWTVVRWITAADNVQARAVYDKLAQHTAWQTYEMPLPVA